MLQAVRLTCSRGASSVRAMSTVIQGGGSLAVVFGGFGFTQRQLAKHEELYKFHGFQCHPVLSTIRELITPELAAARGPVIAEQVMAANRDVVIHTVSGSFWTAMYMLAALPPKWREAHVRAIMFDSCPPCSDVQAFGGWLAWFLQARSGGALRADVLKPVVSHLFHPVRPLVGIDGAWTAQNHERMFGEEGCVVPKGAACLFVRGRHDTVLESTYVDAYADFLKSRTTATVEQTCFEKAQHAMAVVEDPEKYKLAHVEELLAMVPEWKLK